MKEQHQPDEALMLLYQQGDQAAFEKLYKELQPVANSVGYKII